MKGYLDTYKNGLDLENAFYEKIENKGLTDQSILVALLWIIICILFEIGKRNVSGPTITRIK